MTMQKCNSKQCERWLFSSFFPNRNKSPLMDELFCIFYNSTALEEDENKSFFATSRNNSFAQLGDPWGNEFDEIQKALS